MNIDLENKLVEKYSEFFEYLKEYDGPIMPIQFGFECGSGWYVILDTLMSNIQHYIKYNESDMKINITQIKEKFGGLRFYYDGGNDYIDGMVSMTESLSYRTCEFCGTTHNVGQTSGWISTICEECFNKGTVNQKEWIKNEG